MTSPLRGSRDEITIGHFQAWFERKTGNTLPETVAKELGPKLKEIRKRELARWHREDYLAHPIQP